MTCPICKNEYSLGHHQHTMEEIARNYIPKSKIEKRIKEFEAWMKERLETLKDCSSKDIDWVAMTQVAIVEELKKLLEVEKK